MWDNSLQNIKHTGSRNSKRWREIKIEENSEGIDISPKLAPKPEIQEAQSTPSRVKPETAPIQSIPQKIKNKTIPGRSQREKLTCWEATVRITPDSSSETMEARGQWSEKRKIHQLRLLHPAKLVFKDTGEIRTLLGNLKFEESC